MNKTLELNPDNLRTLCLACVEIARQARSVILDIYNTGFDVIEKADSSPLTDADIASHRLIVERLSELTPAIPVISEESERPAFEIRSQWQTYWLIDPIDGTREFVKRNGEFTVNIALIHQHRSIIGVVNVPVQDIDYYAWEKGGAYKVEQHREPVRISVKKLGPPPLIVAGSRSHGSNQMKNYLSRLGDTEILRMGSSLKLCLVAEGRADLYPRLGPTAEWDTAAAHCIVEEAGGYITRTDMSTLRYNTKDSLLNPHFFVFGDDSRNWSLYLEDDH